MTAMIDTFRDQQEIRKAERKHLGVPCPSCIKLRPKAPPKILLPGGICRAHLPHVYRDPRFWPTPEEYNALMAPSGIQVVTNG